MRSFQSDILHMHLWQPNPLKGTAQLLTLQQGYVDGKENIY